MYPFDFTKSKNYWQILGLPTVDANNRISNDMSMRQIKIQFDWKLDYNKRKIEELNNQVANANKESKLNPDFSKRLESNLINILDVINAYLTFREPILFYKYNCFLSEEDAYFTNDPYCGYNYLYKKDLDYEERSHFANKINEMNASLYETFSSLKAKIPSSTDIDIDKAIKIQNLMDAINVGLKDIADVEKKILEHGSFNPNEVFEKGFRTENGLKFDYQEDYMLKRR